MRSVRLLTSSPSPLLLPASPFQLLAHPMLLWPLLFVC
jgi:hypothetical protein